MAAKSGEMYAYNRGIRINFESDIDENELKKVRQTIIRGLSRNKADGKPWEVENMANSAVGLENPETIYKDYLIVSPNIQVTKNRDNISLDFSVYETNKNNLESIPLKIKEHILKTKYKDQSISVEYSREHPTVVNDSELTKTALETMSNIYGDKNIMSLYGQVPYSNDDFAYFQQQIPGVYFFLGGSNFEKNLISMPYSPDFAVDEETIKTGVRYFSSLILVRTNKK